MAERVEPTKTEDQIESKDGYHGTKKESANKILNKTFNPSTGDEHWVGDGAYFFLKFADSNPYQHAENWCIGQNIKPFQVLTAEIKEKPEKILDLNTDAGKLIFNEIKRHIVDLLKSQNRKLSKKHSTDGLIINEAMLRFDFTVIIIDMWFRCNEIPFVARNFSRIPNCRVCVVRDIENCISNIKIAKKHE